MKHNLAVTLTLIIFFLVAELFGLYAIGRDLKISKSSAGQIITSHPVTAVGARPEIKNSQTLIYIFVSVLIGTVLILLLAKFRQPRIWKFWFFLAVWMAMAICLGVFMRPWLAIMVAFALALLKILKPNPISHNVTELLIYAGIALMIVPLLNALWAFILLIAFSVYDMIAVWKSKHMVSLAEFQMQSRVFAGFFIPYKMKAAPVQSSARQVASAPKKAGRHKKTLAAEAQSQSAILGGGDIALPMIFSGAFMEQLVRVQALTKEAAFFRASIISLFATAALAVLLFKSEKGKFYPAMPFLTIGCIVGTIVAMLI